MRRHFVGSLLVLVLGWMVSGGSAHAQTYSASGYVTVTDYFQGGPTITNQSDFDVLVNELTPTSFSVAVSYSAANDNNPTYLSEGIPAVTTVDQAQFAILDQDGNAYAVDGNPADTHGQTNALWSMSVGNFQAGDQGNAMFSEQPNTGIDPIYTDAFSGVITLTAVPDNGYGYVAVTLMNGGSGSNFFTFQLQEGGNNQTPDGASLALIVPGLLSLGVALRRRSKGPI
jgi:hypothetical protein